MLVNYCKVQTVNTRITKLVWDSISPANNSFFMLGTGIYYYYLASKELNATKKACYTQFGLVLIWWSIFNFVMFGILGLYTGASE